MERTTDYVALPSVSLVVEWDNAVLTDATRPRAMLAALRPQLKAVAERIRAPRVELIAVHDDREIPREAVEQVIADELTAHDLDVETLVMTTHGLGYCEQKNAGAARATREIVLFTDCDTVPEDGWLEAMLEGFADPRRQVVAGHTDLETGDFLARCFSLFWFFDRRSGPERETPSFHANNVAFRRALFAELPFPDSRGFRGQHVLLADELRRRGIAIWLRPQARLVHSRPQTLRAAAIRALCQGHDWVVRMDHKGLTRPSHRARRAGNRFSRTMRRAVARIREGYAEVGLGRAGAVAALGLATAYHGLVLAGALLTVVAPDFLPRHAKL